MPNFQILQEVKSYFIAETKRRAEDWKNNKVDSFKKNVLSFDDLEKKGTFYPMFLDVMAKDLQIPAFLFILSTWNASRFSFKIKTFDFKSFEDKIRELDIFFSRLNSYSIKNINLDEHRTDILHIFDVLSKIEGVEFTGSSKLMHLKIPELFIMWDGYIRKGWDVKQNSEGYLNFLKKMQYEFRGLEDVEFKESKLIKDRTFAKHIDEYNYIRFSKLALAVNKEKKRIKIK